MAQPTESSGPDLPRLRHALVDQLVRHKAFSSPTVEAAFRAVPRHLFLPGVSPDQVYQNQPVVTKQNEHGLPTSSSTQPSMMVALLEQRSLSPGQRVLEIGAGTGYNAALIAHLVGPGGHVVTLDVDRDIVERARVHVSNAGFGNVEVIVGDGAQGHLDGAPYDRLIVRAGAWDVLPAWQEQLRPDGQWVVPLIILPGYMLSIAFERRNGNWESQSVYQCGFMYLRGQAGPPPEFLPHRPSVPTVTLTPREQGGMHSEIRVQLSKPSGEMSLCWDTHGGAGNAPFA